jgi:hypothetical protein
MHLYTPLSISFLIGNIVSSESFTGKEGDVGAATIALLILFGPAAAGFTVSDTIFFFI